MRRVQLGRQLRELRKRAGKSPEDVAKLLKTSKSRITAIELGRNVISYTELDVLVRRHYEGTEEQLAVLEAMREEADKRGWWSTYKLPDWLAGYVGLENDAVSVRALELANIPGLLQTETYMRRLYATDERLTDTLIEKHIAARLRRQERLVGPSPLRLTALVSESALMHCVYDEVAAGEQLSHLIEVAQRPNVELRVLPFRRGLHVGMSGPFSLLSFPDEMLPDAGYQEYVVGGHVIDDIEIVSQMTTLFGKLRDLALDANESLSMIAQLARTHD